jgi:LDH2 family malate/lactate/ureidoglycolate dehydrogenase
MIARTDIGNLYNKSKGVMVSSSQDTESLTRMMHVLKCRAQGNKNESQQYLPGRSGSKKRSKDQQNGIDEF